MIRPKVILHIGTMKTGTTSVQASLASNPEWLAARGMSYLGWPCRDLARIQSQLPKVPEGNGIILSDEGFWHFLGEEIDQLAQVLAAYDVTILVYFRRPDGFLESWYSQGLKTSTGNPSFPAFSRSPFVRAGTSFGRRLARFGDIFGHEKIRVAAYEVSQLADGDIVTDFLIRSGLAPAGSTAATLAAEGFKTVSDRNISPDASQVLYDNLMGRIGAEADPALPLFLQEIMARKTPGRARLLYACEARAINERHRNSFSDIQARYGGGVTDTFFADWDSDLDPARTSPLRPLFDAFTPREYPDLPPDPEAPSPEQVREIAARALALKGRPLRPVFVIQNLAGLSGGAERVFLDTIASLRDRGMEPRIVTFDPYPGDAAHGPAPVPAHSVFPVQPFRGRRPPDGRQVGAQATRLARIKHLFKAVPNVFPLSRLKWQLTHGVFARALTRDLRTNGGDVVVAFLPPAISAGAIAARALGVPMIASTHNVPAQDFGNSPRWDQNPIYRARARRALRQADRVTVLLPEFANWFSKEHRDKVVVLPNPVTRVSAALTPPPPREPLILGVGRLTEIKRWSLLIEAFCRIAADLPEWRLRIHGEGPEQAALEAQIAASGLGERIALCPVTQEIGQQYDTASLLCHPSSFEGFGLAVAEAMAHGLPAVAFAECAGVNRLIHTGQDGLLVTAGDDPAGNLAGGLLALARLPQMRARFGQQARQITRRFDRETLIDLWSATIAGVVIERAGR